MKWSNEQRRYADVLIRIGIALKPGQDVFVEAPAEAEAFVPVLLEAAYRAGAGETHVLFTSEAADRVRACNQPLKPQPQEWEMCRAFADRGAGYIRLLCPDFSGPDGLSADTVNRLARLSADRRKLFRASKAHGGFTLACVPCQSWADRVFPDLEREKRMDALWDLVLGCMRCGEEDPVEAWKDYIRRTKLRKELLDGAGYERYRFLSARTDLTLEPAQGARWMGGCNEFPGERVFIPNLPTEEVFCVPHRQKVNGRVGSSLPLNYGGGLIEDFTLWLEDGRIVDYRAEKGQELLAAIIETDEGSHYLGEFALVDQRSPIAGTGRVLYTTLYDENAACHLAIGATAGPEPEGDAQGRGFNRSALHVDFMFGSDDLRVSGRKKDGTWEDIMRNGRWTGRFA